MYPTNYPSLMLDIEMLSTRTDASIVQISAVIFSPFELYDNMNISVSDLPHISMLVDPKSQPGRHVDPETLTWWGHQSTEVYDQIFGDHPRLTLVDSLTRLGEFIGDKVDRIWAQGTDSDIAILRHAYDEVNVPLPWKYSVVRDCRTLMDLVQVNLRPATHDALDDCFRQICGVQRALDRLGITRFIR